MTNWLDLDSQITYWREQGVSNNFDFLVGDANLVYRFAQGPHGQFRSGIGVNWLAEDSRSEAGFNFTYGCDIFLNDPFIFSGDIDWGSIGEANLFRGRFTIGAVTRHVEPYVGYEYFSIGQPELHSLVLGLRVWY